MAAPVFASSEGKAIIGEPVAPPTALVFPNDGVEPIRSAENDDGVKVELLELREEGKAVVARIRLQLPARQPLPTREGRAPAP